MSLTKSIRRSEEYAIGGVAVVLAFDTLLPNGKNAATITRGVDGGILTIELATGFLPVRLEFEENEALFSDNTTFGANKFPKHTLGLKFNGRDQTKNAIIKTLELNRCSFVVRLHSGAIVALGIVNGLTGEKSDSGAGAKSEDFFGYDVTLSGAELEKAPTVDQAAFDDLAEAVVD